MDLIVYHIHDFGLHTEIDNKGKDYSGKGFNERLKKTVTNLRKWNTIIRISNSKERRLSNVLTKINEICSSRCHFQSSM